MTERIDADPSRGRAGDRRRRRHATPSRTSGSTTSGRKAELPNLLRSVAELPPEERAATGKAANEARKALEPAIEQRAERARRRTSSSSASSATASTSRCPATRCPAIGRLHLMTQTRREIEDVFIGLGFNVAEGPEVETVYYNFDALNHAPTHPSRLMTDTFYVEPTHDIFDPNALLLRVHTSPVQIRAMEQPAAADLHRHARARLPPRQRRHPHAAVPPDRGARGRHRHHARRPPGHAAGVRARDLRRRARGPPAPALLPVHRAERRGRRVVLQLQGRA